ncbi:MAG: hypothetical protein ABEK04_05205 [Candidatus Nanohalobium sp.]
MIRNTLYYLKIQKRKGIKATNFIIGIVIGLLLLLVIGGIAITVIQNSGRAAKGCSTLASLISDMTGGRMELC